MKILQNEPLAPYTTFKMGGTAGKMYFPESAEELQNLMAAIPSRYIMGGGSNLLINDEKIFDHVVHLRDIDNRLFSMGNGEYYAGASVRLQHLIRTINDDGYGGIEYLFSVPGYVGGAVAMNAGRGNRIDVISKFVTRVRALVDGEIVELSKEECQFVHRGSAFKNTGRIVLGAYFKFLPGEPEKFAQLRKDRINYCREKQDAEKPNFGTCFRLSNVYIMKLVRYFNRNRNKGVHFSGKTNNWLLNENGTFQQAMKEIRRVKRLHKCIGKECETEVIIWN